tara:strand:+ start:9012 stop:9956 length:945 start_codon:yes stop_codon:yes gene_type:complete
MPRNVYFSQGTTGEQNLYEDITIEGLKIYGHDAYYIPRKIVNEDSIFNEDQLSSFGSSYMIEAYVANVDGYEGEGDLLSKFGLEIKDQVTLVIANRRWEQLVGRHVASDTDLDRSVTRRPMEGDLVYLPFAKGLFEITFVEAEDPFYQLQNLPTFQLKCELFKYSGEDIDTGVDIIDTYETQFADRQRLTLGAGSGDYHIGENISQIIPDESTGGTRTISAEVAEWDSVNKYLTVYGVQGFDDSPGITFVPDGNNIIGETSGASYVITNIGADLSTDLAQMESVDPDSDNSEFETIGNNFIDFSVDNPFGLPNA